MLTSDQLIEAFDQYNTLLFKYVYTRLGGDREACQDLVQHTFTRAWQYRQSFDAERSSLKNWLFVITKNLLKDAYHEQMTETLPLVEDLVFEGPDLEAQLDQENRLRLIHEKIRQLSPEEQHWLDLRYAKGLSLEEISQTLHKSNGAVRTALSRTLAKLKELCHDTLE